MKSLSFFLLSISLVAAILAPSVITIVDKGCNAELAMDFNEEDNKKEEKEEIQETDFFVSFQINQLSDVEGSSSKITSFYPERNDYFSTSIFLPPPEHTL